MAGLFDLAEKIAAGRASHSLDERFEISVGGAQPRLASRRVSRLTFPRGDFTGLVQARFAQATNR